MLNHKASVHIFLTGLRLKSTTWDPFIIVVCDDSMFQLQSVFGLRGRRVQVYTDANLATAVQPGSNTANLASKTLYVSANDSSANKTSPSTLVSPVCHFANVEYKGQKGTLLLENPRGDTLEVENLLEQV